MIGNWECLYHAVVCDCDRLVSPFMGTLQNINYLRDTVHIAHLCMAVKLHTFLRRSIHSGFCEITDLADSGYRTDCQFSVKFIDRCYTLDFQKSAFLDIT